MTDSETTAALRRAAQRALFHMLRAGLEYVKALEAIVEELSRVGEEPEEGDDGGSRRVRIDIE